MRTLGVKVTALIAAAVLFTSNVVLASTGLITDVAAGQTVYCRFYVPITVGAAGGAAFQLIVPAGGVVFNLSALLVNTVAPSITSTAQAASAAVGSALANAGQHFLMVEATIVNGANAGTIDLQMAQNSSNATPLTVLRGGYADFTKL